MHAALALLAGQFESFAAHDCPEEPLYSVLCRVAAQQDDVLALMLAAPQTQRKPNLLLAAVHERLLRDADNAAAPDPLAAYFASVGGMQPPDAALPGHFLRFVRQHSGLLRDRIASSRTQTNEIGRCAVLWPALAHIAAGRGRPDLALFDFGCSAGLNLEVDQYRYRYESTSGAWSADPDESPHRPLLACRVIGPPPPAVLRARPWRIVERAGIDLAPVDVRDDDALRWLRACVWPSDSVRQQRLLQAAALARSAHRELFASEDGVAELSKWLERLPADVTPVVFNSWVLAYFTPNALEDHGLRLRALMRRYPLAWLSAEDAPTTTVVAGRPPPDDADALSAEARAEPGSHTWWALTEPGPGRTPSSSSATTTTTTLLARSHPHGRWLHWL